MSKRLVVCCDEGPSAAPRLPTARRPGMVHRLAGLVRPAGRDGRDQIVHCVEPLGDAFPAASSHFRTRIREEIILDLYRFLAANYADGDSIFLLGCGDGAATVHAAAHLIARVGLVRREHVGLVGDAYRRFREDDPDRARTRAFRKRFSREPDISFLGAWDSLRPGGWGCDGRMPESVLNAFHAVAIDERDGALLPALWTGVVGGRRVEQVWFPGSHTDLAGRGMDAVLADAPLRWMVERARESGLDLADPCRPRTEAGRPDRSPATSAGFHRIGIPRLREIGVTWPATESVHRSALIRLGSASTVYAPRNLLRYLARGWRRGPALSGKPAHRSPGYESIRDSMTRQRIESAASTSYSSSARPRTCPSS